MRGARERSNGGSCLIYIYANLLGTRGARYIRVSTTSLIEDSRGHRQPPPVPCSRRPALDTLSSDVVCRMAPICTQLGPAGIDREDKGASHHPATRCIIITTLGFSQNPARARPTNVLVAAGLLRTKGATPPTRSPMSSIIDHSTQLQNEFLLVTFTLFLSQQPAFVTVSHSQKSKDTPGCVTDITQLRSLGTEA